MKTKIVFTLIASFCVLLSTVCPPSQAQRVYLDIKSPDTRKINIAVPWFFNKSVNQQKQKVGRDLADTLARALQFHGIIEIIPTSEYNGNQAAEWKNLKADYVVLGQYILEPDDVKLDMRLLDVAGDEIIMGKSYSGSFSQHDSMLYKYCDSVIETLTGRPGIADSRIAFINQDKKVKEVFLTDILGNSFRQVTRHNHLTVSPRFVPNGYNLSYSSYHTGNQNLYITDLRQSKTTRALSRRKGLNLGPAWFKDGEKMVLTLSTNGSPDLYLLDSKGNIIEQLTSRAGINVSPTLSADNNHMVFVSDRSGKPQLYYMDLRTRQVRRLTYEGTENAEPNWSPTENLIVYSSLRDGVYQLFTMDPFNQDSAKQLTFDLTNHESPCWSPDGNQVIFSKRDGKNTQIYGILRNGSYQRRLFTHPGSQSYPQWAR
jgi:TolB protein